MHHGNGTEDIVRKLVPSEEEHPIQTPLFRGSVRAHRHQPWLDEDDADSVLFVSTHGYGRKRPEDPSSEWFYPASGATCGCLPPPPPEAGGAAPPAPGGAFSVLGGAHDASRVVFPAPGEPQVMNVGLGLLGPDNLPSSRLELRDAYRRTILPRVEAFKPDLILISAGFDAHKRDEMNWGYLALLEDDYAWLTRSITGLANKVCNGRVVSMLEGGYRVHGGPLSSFARSVAAHVGALSSGSLEHWDRDEALWESEHENKLSRDLERRRALKAEKERARVAAELEARLATDASARAAMHEYQGGGQAGGGPEGSGPEAAPTSEVSSSGATGPSDSPPAKRSRRGAAPVDYAALAAKLEAEKKE